LNCAARLFASSQVNGSADLASECWLSRCISEFEFNWGLTPIFQDMPV
jgi:hypothetical protein